MNLVPIIKKYVDYVEFNNAPKLRDFDLSKAKVYNKGVRDTSIDTALKSNFYLKGRDRASAINLGEIKWKGGDGDVKVKAQIICHEFDIAVESENGEPTRKGLTQLQVYLRTLRGIQTESKDNKIYFEPLMVNKSVRYPNYYKVRIYNLDLTWNDILDSNSDKELDEQFKKQAGWLKGLEKEIQEPLGLSYKKVSKGKYLLKIKFDHSQYLFEKTQYYAQWTIKGDDGRPTDQWNINKKIVSKLSPERQIKYYLSRHDAYYEMSDDFRSWSSGSANAKRISDLYAQLNDKEKKAIKPLMVKARLMYESIMDQIKNF